LAVSRNQAKQIAGRLAQVRGVKSLRGLPVVWEDAVEANAVTGTVSLSSGRFQHFVLHLDTFGEHLVVRCVSPVGRLDDAEAFERVKQLSRRVPEQLGIIEEGDDRGTDLTVEEEVLLGDPGADVDRIWLVRRVAAQPTDLRRSSGMIGMLTCEL
jgi:hypothetical protein